MPRLAETNAEWPCCPINSTNVMFTALGRVFPLLQGLGGYTRGCTDAPPRRKLHTFKDQIQLERPHQHDGDIPSGCAMVLEVAIICIDNLEWPSHSFSSDEPRSWIRLLQECSPEHHYAPAEQNQDHRGQHPSHALEGLSLCRADAHPYKGSGATVGYHD